MPRARRPRLPTARLKQTPATRSDLNAIEASCRRHGTRKRLVASVASPLGRGEHLAHLGAAKRAFLRLLRGACLLLNAALDGFDFCENWPLGLLILRSAALATVRETALQMRTMTLQVPGRGAEWGKSPTSGTSLPSMQRAFGRDPSSYHRRTDHFRGGVSWLARAKPTA